MFWLINQNNPKRLDGLQSRHTNARQVAVGERPLQTWMYSRRLVRPASATHERATSGRGRTFATDLDILASFRPSGKRGGRVSCSHDVQTIPKFVACELRGRSRAIVGGTLVALGRIRISGWFTCLVGKAMEEGQWQQYCFRQSWCDVFERLQQ